MELFYFACCRHCHCCCSRPEKRHKEFASADSTFPTRRSAATSAEKHLEEVSRRNFLLLSHSPATAAATCRSHCSNLASSVRLSCPDWWAFNVLWKKCKIVHFIFSPVFFFKLSNYIVLLIAALHFFLLATLANFLKVIQNDPDSQQRNTRWHFYYVKYWLMLLMAWGCKSNKLKQEPVFQLTADQRDIGMVTFSSLWETSCSGKPPAWNIWEDWTTWVWSSCENISLYFNAFVYDFHDRKLHFASSFPHHQLLAV